MRAFVAIPLPASFSDWLDARRTGFSLTVPRLRLVSAASCHITLRFLGELPDQQVDDVAGRLSLATTPETTIVLDRLGVFRRDGHPTVLWVGPGVVPQALTDLALKVDASLSGVGSNSRTELFVPHVTLGRFPPGMRDDELAAIESASVEPFVVPVKEVVLYESIMGQGHPVYAARASVRLVPFAE
ncbi:MAG: RNA 2',3'-cyclic phosphodiesterase [Candidatus Cryosericum sp.]